MICNDEGPGSGFYGASKVAVEAFSYGYRQAFGTDFIVLRPSAVYGFGMQHPIFVKPMVEDAVQGRPTPVRQRPRVSPRLHPRRATWRSSTLRRSMCLPIASATASSTPRPAEPLRTAGELAEIVRRWSPAADIEIGAGLVGSGQAGDPLPRRADIDNATEQLGYRPRFTRLEDGVRGLRPRRTAATSRRTVPA